jgi:hypothetical protein
MQLPPGQQGIPAPFPHETGTHMPSLQISAPGQVEQVAPPVPHWI